MKLLLWVPPWAAHGDLNFYKNSVQKHLIPQGNILSNEGWDVSLFLPAHLNVLRAYANNNIKIIDFDVEDQLKCFGTLNDLSIDLYKEDSVLNNKEVSDIATHLCDYLDSEYDVIMLWETPVPFLEKLFPNALIVNQMPGVFSRAPYPHFVTLDINGLYKTSTLTVFSEAVKNGVTNSEENNLAKMFIDEARVSINASQPFTRKDLDPAGEYERLILVPLQVSAHYSFQTDTPYSNQMEFLLDVLKDSDPKTGIVVTQYVTPRVADTILSEDVIATLKGKWPNLIYKPIFDKVASVSQFILPLVDEIVTCSSSLGLQAITWGRHLKVYGDTYLKPYCERNSYSNYEQRSEASLNILSFLLARNQPLASVVTKDGKFLSALLNELISYKRNGINDLKELPSFLKLDPDYDNKVMESFRLQRVLKDLSQLDLPIGRKTNEIDRFNRFANDSNVKVISFDVFDTLVHRPTEVPIDFFKFLDRTMLKISNGVTENFSRIRQVSEMEARLERESQEVTLDEIYKKLQDFYKLSDGVIEEMKMAEIDYELTMITSRPAGKKLWDIAKKTGKPIYIISDMYLPQSAIVKILELNGYIGYQKLFLSNDYDCSKKDGQLFDLILDELNISPDSILHIGDNKIADSEQPKSRGIRSYRILRAIDRMRGSEFYTKIYPARSGNNELARSAIAGLTAQKLFDNEAGPHEKNSHFHGEPANLGYAGMGPFVTGFMLWLGRQAKRDNISHLYFLSREGWLLKQIYDVLHKDDVNAVPSTYLYASRRATRVASLKTSGDVIALAGHPFQNGVAVGDLLADRFGIDPSSITNEQWKEAEFIGPEDLLSSDPAGRKKLASICSVISHIILSHSESERANYLSYVNSTGLDTEKNPAVVDVGWRANMQGALSELTGKALSGYYYATLQGTEVWLDKGLKCWGYMGDLLSANHPSTVVQNRPLLEYLVCHTEPSLITMLDNNGFRPVFRPESNIGHRRAFLELVHQGAIQFATDFIDNFKKSIDQIWIDPFLAEKVLTSFFQSPHTVDAKMFMEHAFEDALAGVKKKYIISPTQKDYLEKSVWKQGAAAVYAQKVVVSKTSATPAAKPKPVKKEAKAIVPSSENINSTVKYSWARILENKIIKSFVSKKKYAKYQRDRELFFKDSRSTFAQKWYQTRKS
ncbi:TPA: HAD family hydrolase [Enterobacter roggenkampii]